MLTTLPRPARPAAAAALLCLLAGLLALPLTAGAQTTTRQISLNQLRAYGWPAITVNFNLRSLNGATLNDVAAGQFTVTENDVPQQVSTVAIAHDLGVPLSVVMVLDTSGSMEGAKLSAAQQAGIAFVQALGPNDQVAFLPFSAQVRAPTTFTTDKTQIAAAFNAQRAAGNTALYDALLAAARLSNTAPEGNRRVIVLLTDGQDDVSHNALPIAVAAARQAGTQVFAIGVGGDTSDAVMSNMSGPTGGQYLKALNPSDLKGIYQNLAQQLAAQFLLTYQSTTQVHKIYEIIKVKIQYKAPTGEVLTMETRYRPPASAVLPEPPEATPTALPPSNLPLPAGFFRPPPAAAPTPTPPPATSSGPLPPGALAAIAGILAAIAVLLGFGGAVLLAAPTAVRGRLDRFVAAPGLVGVPGAAPSSFSNRVLLPMFSTWGKRLDALSPRGYLEQVQRLLYQSGPPYRLSRVSFLGLQAAVSVGVGLLFLLYAVLAKAQPLQFVLAALLGMAIGFYVPYFMLTRRVTRRKKQLLRALPGALDFLAIMVEAGNGFDTALTELVRRWQNTLTDEFALLLIDFQIGKPRREAWRELTLRTAVQELNSFVVAMLQSEQTGASIGSLLRTQADQMRIRRRQRAEEEARMAPVKMLIPMALFIFPCILIVILGPAIPQIFSSLANVAK